MRVLQQVPGDVNAIRVGLFRYTLCWTTPCHSRYIIYVQEYSDTVIFLLCSVSGREPRYSRLTGDMCNLDSVDGTQGYTVSCILISWKYNIALMLQTVHKDRPDITETQP